MNVVGDFLDFRSIAVHQRDARRMTRDDTRGDTTAQTLVAGNGPHLTRPLRPRGRRGVYVDDSARSPLRPRGGEECTWTAQRGPLSAPGGGEAG